MQSLGEWINKSRYIDKVGYYTAIDINGILLYAAVRIDVINIKLKSELHNSIFFLQFCLLEIQNGPN